MDIRFLVDFSPYGLIEVVKRHVRYMCYVMIFSALTSASFAQNSQFPFSNNPTVTTNGQDGSLLNIKRESIFKKNSSSTITINTGFFDALLFSKKSRIIISNFSLPNHGEVTLIVDKFEAVSSDVKYILGDSTGGKSFQKEPGIFLRGTIAGGDSSHVFLAVFRNYCFGIVETNYSSSDDHSHYQIMPKNYSGIGSAVMEVQELSKAELSKLSGSEICGSHLDSTHIGAGGGKKNGEYTLSARTPLELDICVDTDYLFYQKNGNNFQYAASYALAIMAATSAVYQRDMNVMLRVNFLRIWNIVPGNPLYPYPNRNAYGHYSDYNFALRDRAKDVEWPPRTQIQRAVVNLLSGDNASGIASGVGHLCVPSSVAESGSDPNSLYLSVWTSAHEIGHVCGSWHSHDLEHYNPPIDDFVNYSIPCISGGSIMSYCVPKNNYFHAREQTRIRNYIETQINSCVRANINADQDLELTAIQIPQDGATIHNGKTGIPLNCQTNAVANFIPSVTFRNRSNTTSLSGTKNIQIQIYNNANATPVYTATKPIDNLDPSEYHTETFTALPCSLFIDADSPYRIVATALHAADPIQINNSKTSIFQVSNVAPTQSITITNPDPNDANLVFTAGQIVEITFTTSPLPRVRIEFSANDGATWVPIDSNTWIHNENPTITTFSIGWTVPAIATTTGRIRVYHLNSIVSDISIHPFTIVVGQDVGVERIINPLYPLGDFVDNPAVPEAPFVPSVIIKNYGHVNQTNIPVKVTITRVADWHLNPNGKGEIEVYSCVRTIPVIQPNQSATLNTFLPVSLANKVGTSNQYMIYVETQSQFDDNVNNNLESRTFIVTANAASIIVDEPSGQKYLQSGADYIIKWRAPLVNNCQVPPAFPVTITYSTDGIAWLPIAQNINTLMGQNNTYTWHVPNNSGPKTQSENTVRIHIQADPDPHLPAPCPTIFEGFSEFFNILPLQPPSDFQVKNSALNGDGIVTATWRMPKFNQKITVFQLLRAPKGGTFEQIALINPDPVPNSGEYSYIDATAQRCIEYTYAINSWLVDVTTVPDTWYNATVFAPPITPLPTWETTQTITKADGHRRWDPSSWDGDPGQGQRFDVYGDAATSTIRSSRVQFIIRASELTANGFGANSTFTDIGFFNQWNFHDQTLHNFQIRMKETTASEMPTNGFFDNTNLTIVVPESDFTPNSEDNVWNMHSIAPFQRIGNNNILVDVSFRQNVVNNLVVDEIPIGRHQSTSKIQEYPIWNKTTFITSPDADITNALSGTLVTGYWREDFRLTAERIPVSVVTPNTNVKWIKGRNYNISWNPGCNQLQKVNIRYIDYADETNNEIITPNGADNTGSFAWTVPIFKPNTTIPKPITEHAKIRIEEYGNPSSFDESDVKFEIGDQNSSITVTNPTLDLNWMMGSRRTIQWTTSGLDAVAYVNIEYLVPVIGQQDNWITIASAIQNTGSYMWDIRGVPLSSVSPDPANARIRVSDYTNNSISAVSQMFYVTSLPIPTLISATPSTTPSKITVVWTEPTGIDPADHNGYFVCRGADATSTLPIASVAAGITTYVDESALECVRYFYTIQSRTIFGATSVNSNSENTVIQAAPPFTVISPNGGEHWVAGTVQNITWNMCNVNFNTVKIDYSLNDGVSWITVASSVSNSGSYRWTVPNFASQHVRIRIKNATAPYTPSAQSESVFEIIVLPPANISTGTYHNLVLKPSTGTVSAWGYNSTGQIGDGTFGSGLIRRTPTTVSGLAYVKKVAAGGEHSLALINDGTDLNNNTVWAWGCGWSGQLGNNSTTYANPIPVKIENLSEIKDIAAGGDFSMALKSNGTVYCWGRNTEGQMGDGGTENSLVPKQVSGLSNVVAIAAGEFIALALKNDGTLYAWGTLKYDFDYPAAIIGVGDGNKTLRKSPVFLLADVVNISAHANHILVVKSNGTVFAWGDNYMTQLGLPWVAPAYKTTPQQIPNFNNVSSVVCGINSSFAVKTDGTIWGWGAGNDGQLGNGQFGAIVTPMQITTNVNNVTAISCGAANSLIYKKDGTVCTSGLNMNGVLGDPSLALTYERNLFGCLSGNYAKSLPQDDDEYTLIRVHPLPEGETDSLQLRYRLMEFQKKSRIRLDIDEEISIHPNPSSTSITVQINKTIHEESVITLSNILGQVVYTASMPTGNKPSCKVEVSGLSNGVYIVRIVQAGNIISKSIIINH